MVADGVEVAVEAVPAAGQAEGPQAADEPGEQRDAGLAAGPVGVGGKVGGLGQGGEAEEERQPLIVGDLVDVVGAGHPVGRGQQQRADRVPGGQPAGGGVAAPGDQLVQAQLGHGRGQQQQPGVIAGQRGVAGRPAVQGCGPDRRQPAGRAAAGGVVAAQPGHALRVADLPDGLRGDRGALLGEDGRDLGDRQVPGAQADDPVPGPARWP